MYTIAYNTTICLGRSRCTYQGHGCSKRVPYLSGRRIRQTPTQLVNAAYMQHTCSVAFLARHVIPAAQYATALCGPQLGPQPTKKNTEETRNTSMLHPGPAPDSISYLLLPCLKSAGLLDFAMRQQCIVPTWS